jgi:hypothetical protein
MPEAPKRVTVTSSRPVRRARSRPPSVAELHEQTELGGVLLSSLIRAQLGLAIGVLITFGVLVAALPFAFAVAPRLTNSTFLGLPLPLLVLGVVIYPVVVLFGWFYVRHAERNEREFEDLVRQS